MNKIKVYGIISKKEQDPICIAEIKLIAHVALDRQAIAGHFKSLGCEVISVQLQREETFELE